MEFAECFIFDLADPLSGDVERVPDLVECARPLVAEGLKAASFASAPEFEKKTKSANVASTCPVPSLTRMKAKSRPEPFTDRQSMEP